MVEAQEQASRHSIIDLTQGEDDEELIQVVSQAASRAHAAANRLTTQFDSLASVSKATAQAVFGIGKDSPPRKDVRPAKESQRGSEEDILSHQLLSLPDNELRTLSVGTKLQFRNDASPEKLLNYRPSISELAKRQDKPQASNSRPSRAAAQSARQRVSEWYNILNPLEAQLEASSTTPGNPGQPETDQWTPDCHLGAMLDNIDGGHNNVLPKGEVNALATSNGLNGSAFPLVGSNVSSELKRKRHSESSDSGPLSKQIKSQIHTVEPVKSNNELTPLSTGFKQTESNNVNASKIRPRLLLPKLAPSSDPNGRVQRLLIRGPADDCKSSSKDTTVAHAENQGTPKLAQCQTQDPSKDVALAKIFETLIYPSIQKHMKRHEKCLPNAELTAIGEQVANEVVDQKLISFSPASLSEPSDDQIHELKRFVKKLFRRRLLSAPGLKHSKASDDLTQDASSKLNTNHKTKSCRNTQTPVNGHKAISGPLTPATSDGIRTAPRAQPGKITNLSEYLRKLENETQSLDLDVLHDAGPSRSQASCSREIVGGSLENKSTPPPSRVDDAQPVHTPLSDCAYDLTTSSQSGLFKTPATLFDAHSFSETTFPPGFDRGRYPAQRRRRGNKYYTPLRSSTTTKGSQPSVQHTKKTQKHEKSSFEDSLSVSDDIINQLLIARVAVDPNAKVLLEYIASGTASESQRRSFQDLTNELCRSWKSHTSGEPSSQSDDRESESDRDRHSKPIFNRTQSSSTTFDKQRIEIEALAAKDPVALCPVSRPPATALDPYLERLIAISTSEDPDNPPSKNVRDRHSITYKEQQELTWKASILKSADQAHRLHSSRTLDGSTPKLTRIETRVVDPSRRPERFTQSLLRRRELISNSPRHNVRELHRRNAEKIKSWRYWKGASGDVVAAAWGPDSTTYAVGAAAHTNPEDVQYNRPCNLLLGDIATNTLTELPDHRIDRPKPETLADTYNARQAVYDACDLMVYETVSSIAFSPIANRMYTASHDRTVKIWDTSATHYKCLETLYHDASVTSVEVSTQEPGLFATASDVIDNSVRVYYTHSPEISTPVHASFSSSRAQGRPDWKIYPECLRWGPTSYTSNLLLAGFHQNDADEPPQEGQLCLWDAHALQFIKVVPFSQSVLAATWHPTLPYFATGGAPGGSQLTDKYSTKSVVRTWDLRSPKHYTMEYECPALDMQDITFHPKDSHIVTAGCTDGTSFVWDFRRPDYPLHRLRHGYPLVDWDHTRGKREEVDTGVMMSLWGLGGSLFYTGSSDGMIKAWDVRRHPQDVLVRNVAQFSAGIQSGAFSPDGTNLLVGDADGGVHVLSSAPCGPQPNDGDSEDVSPELPITLLRASDGSALALNTEVDDPGSEGNDAARYLTNSLQLKLDSDLGVTQNSMYKGPHANHWRNEANDLNFCRLEASKSSHQKLAFLRTPEENEEVEISRRGLIKARKQRISELYSEKAIQEEVKESPVRELPRPVQVQGKDPSRLMSTIFRYYKPPVATTAETVVQNIIPESDMVEENYWWPRLGEEEIEKARAGRGRGNYE